MVMLLWPSKFGTAEIECSFEMSNGQVKTFGSTIYFAAHGTYLNLFVKKRFSNTIICIIESKFTIRRYNIDSFLYDCFMLSVFNITNINSNLMMTLKTNHNCFFCFMTTIFFII